MNLRSFRVLKSSVRTFQQHRWHHPTLTRLKNILPESTGRTGQFLSGGSAVKSTVTVILCVLAATAQEPGSAERFELAGIRLGMPIKEAMGVLRAHNANLRLTPESASYRGLPSALTYAINAVGQGEGFYLMVSMPPNEPV